MDSKARIKQMAMRNAMRVWGVQNIEQLDPVIKLFIETFATLIHDNENSIQDIKEGLLEQIAGSLTPGSLVEARPAHTVMRVMPLEPILEIDRKTIFYTSRTTNAAVKYKVTGLNFSPILDNIRLTRAKINHIICERELFQVETDGKKERIATAHTFSQDANHTLWIGLDIDKQVETLANLHFYIDFPNTDYRHELFDLLNETVWSIEDKKLSIASGITGTLPQAEKEEGIYSCYNLSLVNDMEIMNIYKKQFIRINNDIRLSGIEKTTFPASLLSFFPERVHELEPQYWIKIEFPSYFKRTDLEDINIFLNAFPVSNKYMKERSMLQKRELEGIMSLPVETGEYILSVDQVENTHGKQYNFLPYTTNGNPSGGTYTIKKGGLERFNTRNLADMIELLTDMFRSDLATFNALRMDNIINTHIDDIKTIMAQLQEKVQSNSTKINETPTYLLIDSGEKECSVNCSYWVSNCEIANQLPYGTMFNPLKNLPVEKNTTILLKTTSGGKTATGKGERIAAYKLALTSREQLVTFHDIENYCRMKYGRNLKDVKIKRGIMVSNKPKEGLVRTVDVYLTPAPEYREILSQAGKAGELKEELQQRSPDLYNYRILITNENNI